MFLFLMDTHSVEKRAQLLCCKMDFDECVVINERDHSDGIWCLWKSHMWKVEVISLTFRTLHLKERFQQEELWIVTNVYESYRETKKKALWKVIENI